MFGDLRKIIRKSNSEAKGIFMKIIKNHDPIQ